MRYGVFLPIVLLLTACPASVPQTPTISVPHAVVMYPPSQYTDDNTDCVHATVPKHGTVSDMANTLANERYNLDLCRADRAALRTWRGGN